MSLALTPTASDDTWDLGTLTDGDAIPPGGVNGYTTVIDWGDGATTSGHEALRYAWYMNKPNIFGVHGTHTYGAPGVRTITVTVSDPGQSVTGTATTG